MLRYSAGAFPLGEAAMLFRGPVEMFSLEEPSKSVGIDDSDFRGNTHGLGLAWASLLIENTVKI